MIEAALLLGAYLIGAVPFGVLLARAKGVDLFSVGSGNVGATNVNRALGRGPALLVFALDVFKGVIPSVAARLILLSSEWALVVGAAAIAGHCLSPFLRFRGGKGIATGLGMLIGATPWVAAAAFGVFVISLALCRWVSLSSLLAVASTLVFGGFFGDSGFMLAAYAALLAFVIYRHRANIRRLLDGTEPKFRWNRGDKPETKDEMNQDSGDEESNKMDMSVAASANPANPASLSPDGGAHA